MPRTADVDPQLNLVGVALPADDTRRPKFTYLRRPTTRVQSKVRSLANLAAASATCQPAAAARRSQARRGAHREEGSRRTPSHLFSM